MQEKKLNFLVRMNLFLRCLNKEFVVGLRNDHLASLL